MLQNKNKQERKKKKHHIFANLLTEHIVNRATSMLNTDHHSFSKYKISPLYFLCNAWLSNSKKVQVLFLDC